MNCHVTTTSPLPCSHVHDLRDPNWKKAMLDEYNALITNGTWVLVPRPSNVNVVRFMWLFKHKFHADGSLRRYKARLVANECSHRQDDIILIALSAALLQRIIDSLNEEFAMIDVGSLNYFLGISDQRTTSSLFLSQSKFAKDILEKAHMQQCNPCRTSVDTESKIKPKGALVCLYMHDPREPYHHALKRILRYVRGTLDHGLKLHAFSMNQLVGYIDADWEGCPVTHRSSSGYCVFLRDNLLSWSAKRHVTLSRSSVEAEYRGVANVVAKTAWIHNLLCELHTPLFTATLVYWDNEQWPIYT
nr:ribonuclease H-like domain-containing protein [Tanacetum cinerariifolium]